MSTYISFLEKLAGTKDIELFWRLHIHKKDRKEAAKQIKLFIEQHGRFVPRQRKYPCLEEIWLDCYYYFPTMSIRKESSLKKKENLVKLYKFFFSHKEIIQTFSYE